MIARAEAWAQLGERFDVLVIGGGVTGAGVLFEAARRGLRAALVERGDFASGTSSRSSKLVHGGLRYIKEGKLRLTYESVREREALLREAPALVRPMPFLMPHYHGKKPGRALTEIGLLLYDALAGKRQHRFFSPKHALREEPAIASDGLAGAHLFYDATTDDARLVLELLAQAQSAGAIALNYAEVTQLVANGSVNGALIRDVESEQQLTVHASCIINATGVFADALRAQVNAAPKLRPLRGSHLLLAQRRLPLTHAVAFSHPADARPVFAYPWLGMTLIGTTDIDHAHDLRDEPAIAPGELQYLLEAVNAQFPGARIDRSDIVSTYAGVRPVVASGKAAPSAESRDHLLLQERGLVTITGGKLTTFRPMALAALGAAAKQLDQPIDLRPRPIFERPPQAQAGDIWEQLRIAARSECVVHLDDLLLRRTRLGLQQSGGARALLPQVQEICAQELGWDDVRWQREEHAYLDCWNAHYGVPA